MRECPAWFQDELTRIGGTNPYGEPIFRMVWSPSERMVIGGKWEKDGFVGYKEVPALAGEKTWALMIWEPRELQGHFEAWERTYRDDETGLLQCGGYPKYGRYRLLQKFIHREIIQRSTYQYRMEGKKLVKVPGSEIEHVVYRMEPCGLILDLMLPLLMGWRRLTDRQKVEVLREEEKAESRAYSAKLKDAMQGVRVNRGSELVRKRMELMEAGMKRTMAMAARVGLGMRMEA